MNIVSSFFSGFEHISLAIIGFIMMMGVVVFVHEFGHFYVARLCGVKVIDFSLGFGKKIFSRTDKKGTVWSLSLLPFGGYVRFFGDKSFASDENITELDKLSEEEKKQAFYFKTIPQKMAIVLAGPLANFILSFIIILLLNFFVGTVSLKPIIHDFTPDSIASKNGIEKGDEFLFVN